MDRISKAFKKFSAKEREGIKGILRMLYAGNLHGLNVKKLRRRKDVFRIRKGRIRIIYRVDKNSSIFILTIERRTEKTYRNF